MEETVVVNETKIETRKEKAKRWFKTKLETAKRFYNENKELVIAFGPVVIGGIFEIGKTVAKNYEKHEAREHEDECMNRVYDHSGGYYLETDHRLSNSEKVELDRLRKTEGISTTEALKRMGALK